MPNQRAKDVKQVNFCIKLKLLNEFKERCKADNITVTEALTQMIQYYINH